MVAKAIPFRQCPEPAWPVCSSNGIGKGGKESNPDAVDTPMPDSLSGETWGYQDYRQSERPGDRPCTQSWTRRIQCCDYQFVKSYTDQPQILDSFRSQFAHGAEL